MKKFLIISSIIILILFILFLIYEFLFAEYVFYSKILEVNVPFFSINEEIDTHGGFFNDGEAIFRAKLNNKQSEKLINEIQNNSNWNQLPLPEELAYFQLFTIDNKTNIFKIPTDAKHGYWFFKNRQNPIYSQYDYNTYMSEDRHSSNHSIAFFDTESNTLYYYGIDT